MIVPGLSGRLSPEIAWPPLPPPGCRPAEYPYSTANKSASLKLKRPLFSGDAARLVSICFAGKAETHDDVPLPFPPAGLLILKSEKERGPEAACPVTTAARSSGLDEHSG